MDFGHKIIRTTIGTIIDKSIMDIKNDSERSIIKLVDMGEYFAKTTTQKDFFKLCAKVVNNPNNPYYKIITRIADDVDKKYIKTTGLNFGYQSLNYGADTIRKQEELLNKKIPWMIIFDLTRNNDACISLEKLNSIINEANELGIYSFIFHVNNQTALQLVADTAKQHVESVFFASVSYEYINDITIPFIKDVTNIVLSIEIDISTLDKTLMHSAFDLLYNSKLLYGFDLVCNRENVDYITSDDFIKEMIECKCTFGCMLRKDDDDSSTNDKLYSFVCNIRNVNGKPLLLFDFFEDYKFVSNQIGASNDVIVILSDGYIFNNTTGQSTDINNTNLKEAIEIIMPANV